MMARSEEVSMKSMKNIVKILEGKVLFKGREKEGRINSERRPAGSTHYTHFRHNAFSLRIPCTFSRAFATVSWPCTFDR